MWNVFKRLRFLEAERARLERRLTDEVQKNEELTTMVQDAWKAENAMRWELDRLRSIDGLCAEIEGV